MFNEITRLGADETGRCDGKSGGSRMNYSQSLNTLIMNDLYVVLTWRQKFWRSVGGWATFQ